MSSALTSGRPPPSSVASGPRHLRGRELLRDVAEHRQAEQQMIEPRLLSRPSHPGEEGDGGRGQRRDHQRELRAQKCR